VPIEEETDGLWGFLLGKGKITGDVVSPVFDIADRDALK